MGGISRGVLPWIVVCASASVAHAHISVDQGGTHRSRYADAGLKDAPCGMTDGTRGSNVYTYKPGETITVSIVETISHPGYFRIAFDQDGDNDFVIPSGTDGKNGNCAGDANCGPGKEDYCNDDSVLLDNLDAHAGAFGSTKKYTWSVTLPNVECANCTLQIIQVMNDLNVHFAAYPADDIYYQCIDLVLSNSAMDVNQTPVTNNGMVCEGPTGGAGMGAGSGAGGTPAMDAGVATGGMGGTMPAPAVDAGAGVPAPGTGGSTGTAPPPVTGTGGMLAAPGTGGTTMLPPTTPGSIPANTSSGGGGGGGCSVAEAGSSSSALLWGLALLAYRARRRRH